MVFPYALSIIISMITLNAIPSNLLDWDPQSDLQFYESIQSSHSAEYSVVPSHLTVALSRKEYSSMLEKIRSLTKKTSKWVLLQEVNVEGAYYCAYFLSFKKESTENIRAYACLDGSKKTFGQSKYSSFKYPKLEENIFSNLLPEIVDISEYNKDGTVTYITMANENKLQYMAVYNLKKGHKRNDIFKIVSLIKSTVLGKSS